MRENDFGQYAEEGDTEISDRDVNNVEGHARDASRAHHVHLALAIHAIARVLGLLAHDHENDHHVADDGRDEEDGEESELYGDEVVAARLAKWRLIGLCGEIGPSET